MALAPQPSSQPQSMEEVLAQFDAQGGVPPEPGPLAGDILTGDDTEEEPTAPRSRSVTRGASLTLGAGDSLAFGFLDEAGAVVDSLGLTAGRASIWSSGRSFSQVYEENVAKNRTILKEAQQANPGTFLTGQIGGAIAIPFGAGAKGALQFAKVGAVQGGIYGVGSGEGALDSAVEGAKGAAVGGVLGGALGAAVSKVGSLIKGKAPLAVDVPAGGATDEVLAATEEADQVILGYARGNVPIVAARETAVEATGETLEAGARQADELVSLGDVGSIGRKELNALQEEVEVLSVVQQAAGNENSANRIVDVTWETSPDVARKTGEWRIGSLGGPEEATGLLRAIVGKLDDNAGRDAMGNPIAAQTRRKDEDLMKAASLFAQDIGEDAESILATAKVIAGELGNVDVAMATLRTVWAKQSQEVSDMYLMGVDWATASDELVAEAANRVYNLSVLSHQVQKAKTGLGRGLRVNQLPSADEYLKGLGTAADDALAASTGGRIAREMYPLPRTREELAAWMDLWGTTGGDPRRQAAMLEGLLTVPSASRYLRQSFANFFTASILSMPKTVALNIIGPGAISVIRQAERLTGSAFQSINPLASAGERAGARAVAKSASLAYVRTFSEIGDAFRMALVAAERNHTVIGGGGQTFDSVTAFGPFTDNLLNAAGQKPNMAYTLGNLINVFPRNFARLNNGLDEFSKRLAYQGEVRTNAMVEASQEGLTGRAFTDFVEGKMRTAYDEVGHATDNALLRSAERTTLTAQPGAPGSELRRFGSYIQGLRSNYPEFRYIMPIFNVPVNALGETLRRLPIARVPGLNSVLFSETVRELAGELGPVAQADAHGRTLLGAAFLLAGYQMNRMGNITGSGPQEPTDRKIWLQTHQPYSIKVGDQWVRYDKFDILGGLLSIPATVADASTHMSGDMDPQEVFFGGVGALAQWFRDRAALRTAVGLLSLGDDPTASPETALTGLTGSVVAGFFPAAARGLLTDAVTNPYIPLRRSWTDYISSVLPGNDVEVLRNVLGEPVDKALNTIPEALVPVTLVKTVGYDTDPVLDELDRLYQATGYGAGADSTSFSYGFFADKDLKLEDGRSLYTRVMQMRQTMEVDGKTLKQSLDALFNSDAYNSAADADSQRKETSKGEPSRGYMVAETFKRYNKAIKQAVAAESPKAKAYMTAAAAKRADDAYLRNYSVDELVQNPALYDAAGINRQAYEEELTGGGASSSDALLNAFGAQ